jgi:hypothetical protein
MKPRIDFITCLLSITLTGPAGASNWLEICAVKAQLAPVRIKNMKTNEPLAMLQPGDLVYQMSRDGSPTLAFKNGRLTDITPGMKQLNSKHLLDCVGASEPKSAEYPILVRDNPSEAQLIYDEFGIISDLFNLGKVRLGEHSTCPVSSDTFVSGWKRRELESKGVPLLRFCAPMTDNSWLWFDPETGRRRAYYRMMGAEFFSSPFGAF